MSCGVGHRQGLDAALLWLWCKPAAITLIRPLAWEPPYAVGAALKGQKDKKKLLKLHSLLAWGFKDLVLLLLWHGFDPLPGNFSMPPVQLKKKSELKKIKCTSVSNNIKVLGGVATVAQRVNDLALSLWQHGFDPWSCAVV